jgi:hypothetical protein
MRPDQAGVILLAASFPWRGLSVDVAVPVGEGPKSEALEWLTAFVTANGRPLLYRIGEEWYASRSARLPNRDARALRPRRAALGLILKYMMPFNKSSSRRSPRFRHRENLDTII